MLKVSFSSPLSPYACSVRVIAVKSTTTQAIVHSTCLSRKNGCCKLRNQCSLLKVSTDRVLFELIWIINGAQCIIFGLLGLIRIYVGFN